MHRCTHTYSIYRDRHIHTPMQMDASSALQTIGEGLPNSCIWPETHFLSLNDTWHAQRTISCQINMEDFTCLNSCYLNQQWTDFSVDTSRLSWVYDSKQSVHLFYDKMAKYNKDILYLYVYLFYGVHTVRNRLKECDKKGVHAKVMFKTNWVY